MSDTRIRAYSEHEPDTTADRPPAFIDDERVVLIREEPCWVGVAEWIECDEADAWPKEEWR